MVRITQNKLNGKYHKEYYNDDGEGADGVADVLLYDIRFQCKKIYSVMLQL